MSDDVIDKVCNFHVALKLLDMKMQHMKLNAWNCRIRKKYYIKINTITVQRTFKKKHAKLESDKQTKLFISVCRFWATTTFCSFMSCIIVFRYFMSCRFMLHYFDGPSFLISPLSGISVCIISIRSICCRLEIATELVVYNSLLVWV